MLKKFGMVSVGVTAALLAAAPLASAGEASNDNGGDHGHHSEHGHGDHGGKGHGGNSNQCVFEGGSANAESHGRGLLGSSLVQAPVGGLVAPIASCTNLDILNNNLDGNRLEIL